MRFFGLITHGPLRRSGISRRMFFSDSARRPEGPGAARRAEAICRCRTAEERQAQPPHLLDDLAIGGDPWGGRHRGHGVQVMRRASVRTVWKSGDKPGVVHTAGPVALRRADRRLCYGWPGDTVAGSTMPLVYPPGCLRKVERPSGRRWLCRRNTPAGVPWASIRDTAVLSRGATGDLRREP